MSHNPNETQYEYADFTRFAMSGADFRPVDPNVDFSPPQKDDEFVIHGGTMREVEVYAPSLGQRVYVAEVFATMSERDGRQEEGHRLFVEYDELDDTCDEVYLDGSEEIVSDNPEEAPDRIMKALCAVADWHYDL